MMESIDLKDLDLSLEDLRDITEFPALKRNVSNYKRKPNDELLSAIKESKEYEKSKSKNKERTEIIREELKELGHKL